MAMATDQPLPAGGGAEVEFLCARKTLVLSNRMLCWEKSGERNNNVLSGA